ncbi:MAG: hypothetical protein HYZ44_03365 [Bacteroidetes bacterium]|nr:hypothetical protein [Bacteroidota bacterium]
MKTTEWKKDDIDVQNLLLDPDNFRLPPNMKGLLQPHLLNALIDSYNVAEIARSISENKFYPHESLIVILENKKYIVLEGNRRLAACKALWHPQNLPDKHRKKFTQLASIADLESIRKLPVVIAPTREAAIDLIESLHTAPGRMKWDSLSKARFDKENRSDDKSKLTEANKVLDMYAVASSLNLPSDVEEIVKNESLFNVTNLLRIFNDDHCKKYLGYEFAKDGHLYIKSKPQEFEAGCILLVSDVAHMKSFSRLTDKAADRKKYIDEKRKAYNPDTSGGVRLSTGDFIKELTKNRTPIEKKEPSNKPIRKKTPSSLNVIPHHFKCTISHNRINRVFDEISKLPLEKYPNATAVMLRLLLELSLFQFLESLGEIKKMRAKAVADLKPGQQLRSHWTPELKEMLRWTAKANLVNGHIERKINTIIEKNSNDPVLYTMNQFVHSTEELPDPQGLLKTWSSLEGLLNITLNPQ